MVNRAAPPCPESLPATFFASHATDTASALSFAMDLTPLVNDETLSVVDFTAAHIERLRAGVAARSKKFGTH